AAASLGLRRLELVERQDVVTVGVELLEALGGAGIPHGAALGLVALAITVGVELRQHFGAAGLALLLHLGALLGTGVLLAGLLRHRHAADRHGASQDQRCHHHLDLHVVHLWVWVGRG